METGTKTKKLRIDGMTCISCQNKIERKLRKVVGIEHVIVRYDEGTAVVTYDTHTISLEDITGIIERFGYQVVSKKGDSFFDWERTAKFLLLIVVLYWVLQRSGILNRLAPSQLADSQMGYGMLFVIGAVTSVHCVAMCGGINLSQCIVRKERTDIQDGRAIFIPALLYNVGRVISYTVIGFVLGFAGGIIGGKEGVGLPLMLQGILKIAAGVIMVIMGINMLCLFPGLRKFTPRIPQILSKKVNVENLRNRGPLIVGLLNGFMPCGPLQSMQIVALASGNPFVGALSMFVFSLGTVPLMLGLGSIVSALGKKFTDNVMTVGAVLVVVLGFAMLSQGFSLSGFLQPVLVSGTQSQRSASTQKEIQEIYSTLTPGRYPSITVEEGVPVKWVVDAPKGSINGCNNRMFIQEYGVMHTFQMGENVIEFEPNKTGDIRYSCWMGMIRGNIKVVKK